MIHVKSFCSTEQCMIKGLKLKYTCVLWSYSNNIFLFRPLFFLWVLPSFLLSSINNGLICLIKHLNHSLLFMYLMALLRLAKATGLIIGLFLVYCLLCGSHGFFYDNLQHSVCNAALRLIPCQKF